MCINEDQTTHCQYFHHASCTVCIRNSCLDKRTPTGNENIWKPPNEMDVRKKLIDQINTNRLRELTRLEPIEKQIKLIKLKWFGHLKRRDTPAKTITEGFIPGKRSRGRPSWRWIDDIKLWTEMSIQELNVQTRNRSVCRTLCQNSVVT